MISLQDVTQQLAKSIITEFNNKRQRLFILQLYSYVHFSL